MNGNNSYYLLDSFPRGAGIEEQTPDARWMSPSSLMTSPEYAYHHQVGDRVLLGQFRSSLIGYKDDAHIMTIAGSRAGKGVSAIIPNLFCYNGSVLVIDPKGENANITAEHRAKELGQKVVVLDPFEITAPHLSHYRKSFNPMAFLSPESETLVEDAGLIADALVVVPANAKDPHWDETAKSFIEGVILHVATAPAYEGRRHLITVRQLIMEGTREEFDGKTFSGMAGLEIQMGLNTFANDAVQHAAADFFEKPDNERAGVLSSARRHIKFLNFPTLQSVLQDHHFDLSELKTARQGFSLYLCLPAGKMGICAAWFRLFINLALEAMEREKTKPEIPALFILDEFAVLGHMKQIEDAAGQIAGFGVKLWPILQDLGQLKALYKDRWQTFMGNAGILQFFGNNDIETLEYITRRLGKTSVRVEKQNETTGGQRQDGGSGLSWATEIHDLITPEEAARYFGKNDALRRQLVLIAGKNPMVIERIIYHDHDLFKDKGAL